MDRQDARAFDIEERKTYLVVRQHRVFTDRPEAEAMLTAVTAALKRLGLDKIVVDQRRIGPHGEDVRTVMWDWARGAGRRVATALVVDNELARVRANMTALSSGLQLRAFAVEAQAESWLSATPPRRPTAELPPVE
jgi:hypothetical protein